MGQNCCSLTAEHLLSFLGAQWPASEVCRKGRSCLRCRVTLLEPWAQQRITGRCCCGCRPGIQAAAAVPGRCCCWPTGQGLHGAACWLAPRCVDALCGEREGATPKRLLCCRCAVFRLFRAGEGSCQHVCFCCDCLRACGCLRGREAWIVIGFAATKTKTAANPTKHCDGRKNR